MILGAVLVSFSPHPIFGPNIQSGSRGRTRNKLPQFPRNLKNFNPDYFGFVFGFRVLTMLRDIRDMLVVLPFVGFDRSDGKTRECSFLGFDRSAGRMRECGGG